MRDLSVYGVKCECDNIQSFQALEGASLSVLRFTSWGKLHGFLYVTAWIDKYQSSNINYLYFESQLKFTVINLGA